MAKPFVESAAQVAFPLGMLHESESLQQSTKSLKHLKPVLITTFIAITTTTNTICFTVAHYFKFLLTMTTTITSAIAVAISIAATSAATTTNEMPSFLLAFLPVGAQIKVHTPTTEQESVYLAQSLLYMSVSWSIINHDEPSTVNPIISNR